MSFPPRPSVGFLSGPGSTSHILPPPPRATGKAFWVCPQGSRARTSWGQRRSKGCSLCRLSERAAHSSQEQSPHIVSALAPQNTKRWTHSGSGWCVTGVECNTWSQCGFPCREENSPECTGSPCGYGSKAMFSKWFHPQLTLTPLTCRACGSGFTVRWFSVHKHRLGGQFKKLHKGIERVYLLLFRGRV